VEHCDGSEWYQANTGDPVVKRIAVELMEKVEW